jgi:tetratricopeptide (TPR) repeat protein
VAAYNEGCSLAGQGRIEESLFHFSQALQSTEDYTRGWIQWPWTSLFLRPKPLQAWILYNRAAAYSSLGRGQEALADYDRCIRLTPDTPAFRMARGIAHLESQNFGQALKDFEEVLKRTPNDISALLNASAALMALERYQEASEKAKAVLTIDLHHVEANLMVGRAAEAMGRDWEALESYNAAVVANHPSEKAVVQRMLFHATRKYWTLAARDLCLLLETDSAVAKDLPINSATYLLRMACDECTRLTPASEDCLRFANTLLGILPNDDTALTSLGWHSVFQGRLDEAVQHFSAAIASSSLVGRHFLHRAQVYQKMGNRELAERDYQRAKELMEAELVLQRDLAWLEERVTSQDKTHV